MNKRTLLIAPGLVASLVFGSMVLAETTVTAPGQISTNPITQDAPLPIVESNQVIMSTTEEVVQSTPPTPEFTDVKPGHEHYVAIHFLREKGIIHGYGDGRFIPEREINRAEALAIIHNAFHKTSDIIQTGSTITQTFDDVPANAWYIDFVKDGLAKGSIKGYPDGLFHPELTISKTQSLKIALIEKDYELPTTIEKKPYSDVPLNMWFTPYSKISKDLGLFLESRKDGSLSPSQKLNRGEFVEMVYRLMQSSDGYRFGRTTYYADYLAGRGMSNGDPYNPGIFTTAHKTLPFGTKLRVTNLANGKSVDVKVNDRGPYATGVELDLSKSAFSAIANPGTGIIVTQFQIIDPTT